MCVLEYGRIMCTECATRQTTWDVQNVYHVSPSPPHYILRAGFLFILCGSTCRVPRDHLKPATYTRGSEVGDRCRRSFQP